jgi:type II secretory pathway pseudopilin PulG
VGILAAFAVGYAFGAKAGVEGLEEVVASIKALRDSQEFEALVSATRSYLSHALQSLGESLAPESQRPQTVTDLLGRLRSPVSGMDPPSRGA